MCVPLTLVLLVGTHFLSSALAESDYNLTSALAESDYNLTSALAESDYNLTTALAESDYNLTSALAESDYNLTSALAENDYNSLNFTQIAAAKDGYHVEEHKIITQDHYILTIFRVSNKKCNKPKRIPILYMHGVLQNADSMLDAGPGVALPYLLANDCFDIWVGSNRGTLYGRAHTTLNPDTDKEFWAYSVDEMGIYDMPAHIDYILKVTGSKTINYVGFSQGGGEIMITCSEKPEYNDKMNVIFGMSPATRVKNIASPLLRLLFEVVYSLKDVFIKAGTYELFRKGETVQPLLYFICKSKTNYKLCDKIINSLDPNHPGALTPETVARIFAHFPAGVSVQLLSRYAQGLTSDYFQKYDYGSEAENMAKYNRPTPPIYDLTKVTAPVVISYGKYDNITTTIDAKWLAKQLPNVLEFKEINRTLWTHFDSLYNKQLITLVYPTVKKYMSQCNHKVCL